MSNATVSGSQRGDICPHQFAFMLDNWIRRLVQNPKKILHGLINEGETVLDLGCGPGFFSIDMAKLVGKNGKVIAADLQSQMLDKVRKKAGRYKLLERMEFHQCQPTAIGLRQKVDFVLVYYMIHESSNPKGFLVELSKMLKPGGRILIVEPKMHVSQQLFETMLREAEEAGLQVADFPLGKGGRSVLLTGG